MIDWDKTQEKYGYGADVVCGRSRFSVIAKCDECGSFCPKRIRNKSEADKISGSKMEFLCPKCRCNDPGYRKKQSENSKEMWRSRREELIDIARSEEYRNKMSESISNKWKEEKFAKAVAKSNQKSYTEKRRGESSRVTSELWEDNKYRSKIESYWDEDQRSRVSAEQKRRMEDPEAREHLRLVQNLLWQDPDYRHRMAKARESGRGRFEEVVSSPEYRNKMSEMSRELWEDPEYREKVVAGLEKCRDYLSETMKSPEMRERLSKKSRNSSKRLWEDVEYRRRMLVVLRDPVRKASASEKSRKLWRDPEFRARMEETWSSDEYRESSRERTKALWRDPEFRVKMEGIFNSEAYKAKIREKWDDPEFKARMAQTRASQPRVSSLQSALYSILDDLGVRYYREYEDKENDPETIVGPYGFDCVIPREDGPDLLIECQGDYWHSQSRAKHNDQSKSTYVEKYHPEYELKYLWEHEFKCKDKIIELIKYWLNITEMELAEFEFGDVQVEPCPAPDYKLLLSKYHYLPNAGRGGKAYGAYIDGKLVAACVFSPLVRQNIQIKDYPRESTRELSRLCIHPKYQKKNFASWFVSRCLNMLDEKYNCVVSYCDTTFNHDGAVYKACNFKLDGKVKPDYWYASEDGWVMHKRTLYGHARSLGVTEKEFADEHDYRKIYGREKLRFIYER